MKVLVIYKFVLFHDMSCTFEANPICEIDDLQKLFTLVKVAYIMLIIVLLLMMWASVVRMHELPVQYPPCFFNPLCTCSKAIPDLGIVACYNVPMPRIPQPINSSKMFMLQLENNGLRFLQPQHLMNTGKQLNEGIKWKVTRKLCTISLKFLIFKIFN